MTRHRPAAFLCSIALTLGCAEAPASNEAACDRDPLIAGCTPLQRPSFAGLSAPVEIVRDADGVPHVLAETARDAMYASGYMQAFDRLFQMDLSRRQALGRRAEVLGADYVSEDRLVRIVDIPRWARTNEAALFRNERALWELVQAWTEGVNARIREAIAEGLPPEFGELGYEPEEWAISDAFAFGKLALFGNANQLEFTILSQVVFEYLPELDARFRLAMPARDAFVVPEEERPGPRARSIAIAHRASRALPEDAGRRIAEWQRQLAPFRSGGSNNWALDGRHSANGLPLIAGDPHQPLRSPSLLWVHHLRSADGELDVIGFNFVGGPAVQLGHNRHVVWTATSSYPDHMDLWDVRVVGDVVHAGDRTAPLVRRTETIRVAGGDPIELVCEDVPGLGVLLPEGFSPIPIGRSGRRLLFGWTGFGVTHELEGFWGFDRARSRDEFEASADRIELGLFNFISADAAGISYRSSPRVPDRGVPDDAMAPYLVLDGDDPSAQWDGSFLPLERLPHSRGGTRGWIATANNDPFGFTRDGLISGDPWYFGMLFDPGLRAARIEAELARLSARGRVTLEEMQALQLDTYSLFADDFVPALEEAWAAVPTDAALADFRDRPELDALVAELTAWDRRMDRPARAPVVFHAFSFFLARRVLRDDFSIVFEPIMSAEPTFIMKFLSNVLADRAPMAQRAFAGEPRFVSIARALEETEAWLRARFPSGEYAWGDVHGTRFGSLFGDRLEGGWVPTDGSLGTVDVSNTEFFDGMGAPRDRFDAGSGAIYRMTAGFREDGTPEAFVTFARGVSGEPESPHWSDLHADWIEGRYRRLRYLPSEIEADPVERMTLAP